MKPTKVEFFKEGQRGKADVTVVPSHPLGVFVINVETRWPYVTNPSRLEDVVTRKINLLGVSNKDAKSLVEGDNTVLEEYAKPSSEITGKYKLQVEAEAKVRGDWEEVSKSIYEFVPYSPDQSTIDGISAVETPKVVQHST